MQEEEIRDINPSLLIDAQRPTEVILKFKGIKEELKSTLVGAKPGRCILLDPPLVHDIQPRFYLDRELEVRYTVNRTVYGFSVKVLGFVLSPFPLLFTSYPDEIRQVNLRRFVRISCFIPTIVDIYGKPYSGTMTDISVAGCKVIYKNNDLSIHRIHTQIKLSFNLPDSDKPFICHGNIRNVNLDSQQAAIGIVFGSMPKETLDAITGFMQSSGNSSPE